MYTDIFFLLLLLLLVNVGIENPISLFFVESPLGAFLAAIFLFMGVLSLIYCQKFIWKKLKWDSHLELVAVNLEIYMFFVVYYFVLGAHRLLFKHSLFPITIALITSLSLYFIALAVHFYTYQGAGAKIKRHLLFLIPFTLPILLFTFLTELLFLLPWQKIKTSLGIHTGLLLDFILLSSAMILLLLTIAVLLPRLIIYFWGCKDLQDPYRNRLELVCARAQFKHAGLKIWTSLSNSLTAAILGIVGKFRYVIFTEKLLSSLSPDEVDAVLAHEIGHSQKKHLLYFPFIIFGFALLNGFFYMIFYEPLYTYLYMQNLITPSKFWLLLQIALIFLPITLIAIFYFRIVFGYFSRIFERQADLHGLSLNIPSKNMIGALNKIGSLSGSTHDPNWHHYSINQRMDFLRKTELEPALIKKHHQKVFFSLIFYFSLFIPAFILVFFPIVPENPLSQSALNVIEHLSQKIDTSLNSQLRIELKNKKP